MRRLASLLVLLPFGSVAAQAVATASVVHYRFESNTRSISEFPPMPEGMAGLSAMMNNLGDQQIHVFALLSVTVKDSARGKVYHIVIDSIENNQGEMLQGIKSMMTTLLPDSAAMAASAARPPSGNATVDSLRRLTDSTRAATMKLLDEAMAAPTSGAWIHRFVRDGKEVSQTLSMPNNAQLASVVQAATMLAPQPRMLTAQWNESWVDSDRVAMPSVGEGSPLTSKQRGFTRWRMTAKDTIDAVVATSMDIDTDSTAAAARAASRPPLQVGDSVVKRPVATVSMRNSLNGTHRVILDSATKAVVEYTSSLESSMKMTMGEMGDMTSRSTATASLVRVP